MSKLNRRRRLGAIVGVVSALLLAASCRGPGAAFNGATPADATEARRFLDALAARYTTPLRLPDYEAARARIAHNAFVPSNAWKDTSVWTAYPSPTIRQVFAHGRLTPAGYRLGSDGTAPLLRQPGDSRHSVTLARLPADNVFRWETLADYHVGALDAQRPGQLFTAMFAAAEGRSEAQARADYRAAFPRTTAALGRYASIDTLRATSLRDGTSATRVVISLHAERLGRTYPALAEYLRKYTTRSRARFVVRDRAGTADPATWLVVDARDNRITIDARTRDGRLLPFKGAVREFPDTLELIMDAIATVGPFTAGFEQMRTQLVRQDTRAEQSWELTARDEPHWKLPLFAERLLRSPLRRPFEGAGSYFEIGLQREDNTTVLHRYARVTVQESAILRFFNRLGSRAFGDISPEVEAQEAAFLRLVFVSMRDDLGGLVALGNQE